MTVGNGDILRVDLFYALSASVVAQNVFHWQYLGLPVLQDSEVVGDFGLFAQAWANIWESQASDTASVSSVSISLRGGGGKFTPLGQLPVNIDGGSGQPALPQGCALMIRSAVTGSVGQARKFVPALVAPSAPNGAWNASALTIGADLALLITSDLTQLPAVIGEYANGTYSTVTGLLKPLTGVSFVNTEVNYQRRRRPGVGI